MALEFLNKIFSSGANKILETGGGIIDNLTTSDSEKSKAKKELTEVVLNSLSNLQNAQKEVILAEAKGSWLQRSWRPILMLTFGCILVSKWFGWTDANIPEALELELMSIVKIGLGGYVVGRSAEKIATSVTQNIDLPFIKKKNRDV